MRTPITNLDAPAAFLWVAVLAAALGAPALAGCTSSSGTVVGTGGTMTVANAGASPTGAGGMMPMAGSTAAGGSMAGAPPVAGMSAVAGAAPLGGMAGMEAMAGAGGAVSAGTAGMSAGGASAGAAGMGAGGGDEKGTFEGNPPELLSETGLYTSRTADGELVLADGVREFEPRYKLWSDGTDKRRHIYLPPDTQIDTSDPDHWVLPVGTKVWKSFISNGQLVETRLIERTGEGSTDYTFATYFWLEADDTDAIKMNYLDQLLDVAGTPHDIPNGIMCERCHAPLKDRVLGFSALQLNHDLGGVNLETLLDEGLLTDPIALDIGMPGDDQMTQDALGYLHANCGNCHNDSPGVPAENVPEPRMLLRVSVNDLTAEDTGTYRTAVNQAATASDILGFDYRVFGGDETQSAMHFRMTRRLIEDQMPPIGTTETDPTGLDTIATWIRSLPTPEQ